MRRLSGLCAAAVLTVLVVLASAAVAGAATPLQEYQRTGRITPCNYSPGQLSGGVPNDVAQYAPEYKAQLEAAARARARSCGRSGGGSGSGGSGAGAGGGSGPSGGASASKSGRSAPRSSTPPPAPPIDPTAEGAGTGIVQPAPSGSSSSGIDTPLLILLILGGLMLLGACLALIGRYLGWSPGWIAPVGHSLREARMRVGSAAGGFSDWLRPPRPS